MGMRLALWMMMVFGVSSMASAQRSCFFESPYSKGCFEYVGEAWSDESALLACKNYVKEGFEAKLEASTCPRGDYNTLCASTDPSGTITHTYSNDMPAFICQVFMKGALTKRPAAGWPQ